jgi:hypothetical protein
MEKIKRYDPSVEYHPQDRGYPSGIMLEDNDGDYVLYTDHLAALTEKSKELNDDRGRRIEDRKRIKKGSEIL